MGAAAAAAEEVAHDLLRGSADVAEHRADHREHDRDRRRVQLGLLADNFEQPTERSDARPGAERRKNPSGLMLAALVDMAHLTRHQISDLISLEWSAFGREGITFKLSKTSKSTGASVLIAWTPKLGDVDRRLHEMRKERRTFGSHVFIKQNRRGYTYWGASSLWRKARERAGIDDCRFNDMRVKALTDTEEAQGMQAARRKGAHSTEGQTDDYVKHKKPQKSKATR